MAKPSKYAAAPVLPCEELASCLHKLRSRGKVLVALANGCFDSLHVGHIRYLEAARAEANLLVVAMNDDPQVAALKGPGRPLMPAAQRAALVAALRPVDYVTIFGEPTADKLIRMLRPDVHCKGPDYAGGVPEEPTVQSVGGRIAIVGDPKNHSTTRLFDRVRVPKR